MSIFSQRILLILFCMIASQLSFAETENCSLSGLWEDLAPSQGFNEGLLFTQIGNTVTGNVSFPHHRPALCSTDFNVSGSVDLISKTFVLRFTYNYPNPDVKCELKFEGSFVGEGCSAVQGHWEVEGEQGSTPFEWVRKLEIYEPPAENEFIITAEPRMPEFKAKVRASSQYPRDIPSYKWSLNTFYRVGDTGRVLYHELPDVITDTPVYEADFSKFDGFRGGMLTLLVERKGYWLTQAAARFTIKGTNPGKERIESMLTSPIMRRIACVESRYRQFDSNEREGGIGFPLVGEVPGVGKKGGIGIMQIFYPWDEKDPKNDTKPHLPAKAHWDWRENIKEGIKIFKEKDSDIKIFSIKEHNRLNKEREAKGLLSCPKGTPPPLTSEQWEREIIRRYNYGVEYRWEPRDAPDCKGQWVISPSCVRDKKKNPNINCDSEYVDKVLRCDI